MSPTTSSGWRLLFAVVRQMQIDEDQARESNRNIQEENDAPVKIADDQASGDRSEHGRHQGWYGNKAHGAQKIRLGECSHQGEPAHRHHHRAAATLQDAAGDQQMDVARYSAQKGPEGENADRRCEYAPGSEPVRHPATDWDEDRQAERIARQHRLHAEGSDAEGGRDGGNRRIENRCVQRLHEKGDRNQPRQEPFGGR